MMRILVLLGLILALPAAALAQQEGAPHEQAAEPGSTPAPSAPAPALSSGITPDQARQALDTLRDDRKRAAFINTLEVIARTGTNGPEAAPAAPAPQSAPQPAPKPAPPATAPSAPPATTPTTPVPPAGTPAGQKEVLPLPLAPNSLGALLLVGLSDFVARLSADALSAFAAVWRIPSLWGWASDMANDPAARQTLLDVSWRLVVVILCARGAEWLVGRLLRRPALALERIAPAGGPDGTTERASDAIAAKAVSEASEPDSLNPDPPGRLDDDGAGEADDAPARLRRHPSAWTLLRRLPLVLARLVLDLLPILAFTLVGHVLVESALGGSGVIRLVVLAVVDAYLISRVLLILARIVFSPASPRLRLLHVRDSAAQYAMRWLGRIIWLSVFGYAAAEVGLLLGMTDAEHEALLKAVGFVVHVLAAIVVFQKRHAVRRWIYGASSATGPIATLRHRTAGVWHWIAIFYLIAIWLVWAVELPNGFARLLHAFIVTMVVALAARLLLIVVLGTLDRVFRVSPEQASRYPGLEQRARTYRRILRSGLTILLWIGAFVVLLQFWGLNSLTWFADSLLGRHLVSASTTIIVTVLVALLVWEVTNGAIQRHLAKLAKEGEAARSARLRTLLPLLRTSLLITIMVVLVLMVLSEIGLNIAPLLAGAGIIGVAIGFGSQKLVQDLITGIFLLLENAMQVGDWVTVSGLSGTVENLSIRTIRLRAADGSVHIIPFSSVTSVTNTNRGIGNAAVSVTVAYDEDTDRVSALLTEVAAGMRKDKAFSDGMLSDLQLWGIDKVDPDAVTLAGQIVCTDSGRWPVQREFNRRVKRRFQEAGIRMPMPTQALDIRRSPWDGFLRAAAMRQVPALEDKPDDGHRQGPGAADQA